MNQKPLLFTSLLLDRPGFRNARQLGKIQISSLLRYLFNGDVVIWRNFSEPLYLVERKCVHELDFAPSSPLRNEEEVANALREARLRMTISLTDHASRYSWIIFAHDDVIALRNWDHLFENVEEDILVSKKVDGTLDPGFFAVRVESYELFLKNWNEWQRTPSSVKEVDFLQEIIKNSGLLTRGFERGEVVRPFEDGVGILETMEAAVVHLEGGKPEEKTKLAFALHMMRTFGDKDGLFLDLMES